MAVGERHMPHVFGVEHHYAVVATGVRLHYAQAGPADGEPVVLQHGWPQHWFAWRKVIPELAERGFRVIAPDLRGFGWSDAPRTSYKKQEFADDIAGLLDVLKLDGVRLVGHDWGGYACFLVAASRAERLRSLTAFSINPPWATGKPSPRGAVAALAYQPLIGAPVIGPAIQRHTPFVSTLYRISGGVRIWPPEARDSYVEQFREPARAEAASRIYRSFLLKELRSKPSRVALPIPATLTVGRDDPVVSESLLRGSGDVQIDFVDGGHFLPEEHPDVVVDRIVAA